MADSFYQIVRFPVGAEFPPREVWAATHVALDVFFADTPAGEEVCVGRDLWPTYRVSENVRPYFVRRLHRFYGTTDDSSLSFQDGGPSFYCTLSPPIETMPSLAGHRYRVKIIGVASPPPAPEPKPEAEPGPESGEWRVSRVVDDGPGQIPHGGTVAMSLTLSGALEAGELLLDTDAANNTIWSSLAQK